MNPNALAPDAFNQYITQLLKVEIQHMVACVGLKLKKTFLLEIINLGVISITHGFLTSAVLTFWARYFLFLGACPVQCRMLSNILGLYSLDARSILHSVVGNQKCLQTLAMSPRGKNCPGWESLKPWVLMKLFKEKL